MKIDEIACLEDNKGIVWYFDIYNILYMLFEIGIYHGILLVIN